MGTGHCIACIDCEVNYELGYGSYTNCIFANTLAEYDADPRAGCGLEHNRNRRAVLVAHEGHQLQCWAEDDLNDDPFPKFTTIDIECGCARKGGKHALNCPAQAVP